MALVSDVLDNARAVLIDPLGVRWPDTELIDWLNDAMRQAVGVKPDANPITETFTCVAGPKQSAATLTNELVSLLDVPANASGTEAAITFIKRNVLDVELPTWRTATEAGTIEHFMYDERQRDYFYVYPPAIVNTAIEVIYAAVPTLVTAVGDTLPMQDIYIPALTNYVVWRAFSKDSDFSGNINLAAGYFSAFMQALVGKENEENSNEYPERHVPPGRVLEAS